MARCRNTLAGKNSKCFRDDRRYKKDSAPLPVAKNRGWQSAAACSLKPAELSGARRKPTKSPGFLADQGNAGGRPFLKYFEGHHDSFVIRT